MMNPLLFGPLQNIARKAVLGDGYTMNEAQGKMLSAMNFNAGKEFAPNPVLDPSLFTPKGNPAIGNGTEFDFLNDVNMQLPEENIADSFIPPNPGKASTPSVLGMLPGVGNAVSLINGLINGPQKTTLERADFENVDYNPIIDANNAAIQRGTNTTNYNIKNNARTFGQLNAGMSASNIRGAQAIGENTARLGTMERNTNAQINNRENTINTQISNQEKMINEQNEAAFYNQITNDIIGIGTSIAGFGADKVSMAADFAKNTNFLNSMEYMSPIFRYMFDGQTFTPKTKFN